MSDERGATGTGWARARERRPASVSLRDADLRVEGRLPRSAIEDVADRHAREVWGADVARGPAFPVTDAGGELIAYAISYARGAHEHPPLRALLDEVAVLQRGALDGSESTADRARASLVGLDARFGAVYVSATARRSPILMVRHHLHPFILAAAAAARAESSGARGPGEVKLERIRFVDASDEAFELTVRDRRVTVSPRRDRIDTRNAPMAPGLAVRARHAEFPPGPVPDGRPVWGRAMLPAPPVLGQVAAPVEKRITYWGLVPPIPYTWWCVPTAYTMVMGYWDHYVPGTGAFPGHARIIDHWYEHRTSAHRPDGWDAKVGDPGSLPNNVPPFIDQLIDPATGTWRLGFAGFADFVAKTYGYAVTVDDRHVGSGDDWGWSDIVAEVDAGRPFIWCFAFHAVVGIGYRVDMAGQRYVIYLDTYGATLAQKLKELPADQGKSRAFVRPGSGDGAVNVTLLEPRSGGEVHSGTPAELAWSDDGGASSSISLSCSADAGRTWSIIAPSLPAHPGVNRYRWMPGAPSAKVRLRVQSYAGSTLLGGDGSVDNVPVTLQSVVGSWVKISGPVDLVVAGYDVQRGTRAIYATDADTGDVYRFEGKPGASSNWFKIGGPGLSFVLDGQGVLYGLSPGGHGVWKYTGVAAAWEQIGGAATAIIPDVDGVCAIAPVSGDLMRYLGTPFMWRRIGGPGKAFASDARGDLYGLSPDGSGIWRYEGLFGPPAGWTKVGGAAAGLFGRGRGVYATDPQSGAVRFYHGRDGLWTTVGGPGKAFSVDPEGRLYGLSPDGSAVWRYDGSFDAPTTWTKIGGPAGTVVAGWREVLATDPHTKDLWITVP